MTKKRNRRSVRYLPAIALFPVSVVAWGEPCDDVLERAEQAADTDEAQFILGGCLASRGPAHVQLLAAHALLLLADDDALACSYAEIILHMLEADLRALDPEVIARVTNDAEQQARLCDGDTHRER